MRYFFFPILYASTCLCTAQEKQIGFAVTMKGDTMRFYRDAWIADSIPPDLHLTATTVIYQDAKGQVREVRQSKLKDLYFGDHHFINNPLHSMGENRLQRVVMKNDKYLLTTSYGNTNSFGNSWMLYIYDRHTMKALVSRIKHSSNKERDMSTLYEVVAPYFGECGDAMAHIRSTIGATDYWSAKIAVEDVMFGDISNFTCE
jgi:hypothetical protein